MDKLYTREIHNIFMIALFVLPLIVNFDVLMSYDDVFLIPKLYWLLGVILPVSIYIVFIYRDSVNKKVAGITLVWLSLCVIGFCMGLRPEIALKGLDGRLNGLGVYFSYALILLSGYVLSVICCRNFAKLFQYLIWMVLPLCLCAVAQYYGFIGIIGGEKQVGVAASAVGATLGNRGYFAGLLCVLFPLILEYSKKSRWGRLLLFLICFSFTASLSRGPILAALLGFIYWIIVGKNWIQWKAAVIILIGFLAPLPQITENQQDLRLFNSESGGQSLSDNSARSILWNSALKGIKEKPIFGWGQGQLLNIMSTRPDNILLSEEGIDVSQYQEIRRLSRQPNKPIEWYAVGKDGKRSIIKHNIEAVHNEYLEYALNFGIPAALAYTALLILGIWRGRYIPWAGASVLAYAGYVFTWPETLRFAPIAWAILGVALAGPEVYRLHQSRQQASEETIQTLH